ncbi:hypothetical protein CREGCYN_03040 [Synechococcus sp. M16CYN]
MRLFCYVELFHSYLSFDPQEDLSAEILFNIIQAWTSKYQFGFGAFLIAVFLLGIILIQKLMINSMSGDCAIPIVSID